ncbi:MAG: hypothetical protein IBX63_06815 [Coriobacteriia bacterium]|nr:hypothetical protein [Coriobacteriia bacterium]
MAPLTGPALTEATVRGCGALRTLLLVGVALSVVLGLLVLAFSFSNRLVPMPGSRWFASYEESRFRAAPDLEGPLRLVVREAETRGLTRLGIAQHDGDFPLQLLLSVAGDLEFRYVKPTVLPDRIEGWDSVPDAVVVITREERFDAASVDLIPRGEELLPPQVAAGWVILLHEAR